MKIIMSVYVCTALFDFEVPPKAPEYVIVQMLRPLLSLSRSLVPFSNTKPASVSAMEEIGQIRVSQQEFAASFRRPQAFALIIAGLFFFSGFAALVYQVTWMRHLSLFFGSDVYSAAITLSVFMAGLSLGSYIAERVEDRVTRLCFYMA